MLSEREGISSLRRRRRVVGESPSNLRAISGGRNRFRPGIVRIRDLARKVIGRGRVGGRREIMDGVIWSIPAMAFPCPYCAEAYAAPSEELLMTHIRLVHTNDPNFLIQCLLNGCERTFENFRMYQNHRLTHRREVPTVSPATETEDMDDSVGSSGLEAPSLPQVSTTDMQYFVARWILKTRELRSLTRTAMQGVIQDVSDLVSFVTQTLESQMHAVLQSNRIEPESICGLDDIFAGPVTKPFEGLTSFYQQLHYCRNTLKLIVSLYTNPYLPCTCVIHTY